MNARFYNPFLLGLLALAWASPAWAQDNKPPSRAGDAKPQKAALAMPDRNEAEGKARPDKSEPGEKIEKRDPVRDAAAVAEAKRLSDAFVSVAEKVSGSVVQVEVTAREESVDPNSKVHDPKAPIARSSGSGIVISEDGAILTNNHVIEGALGISVRMRDNRLLPARLVGRDPATDLAVVRVEGQKLVPAKLGNSEEARVGEWVVAIGAPFGLRYTVTAGVLSAKGRGGVGVNDIEDYMQTDASINPGNSGGPLVDLEGRVIGVNAMVVGRGSGIGFAVPANMAKRVAAELVKRGHVERPWLGIEDQDLVPAIAEAMKVEAHTGVLVANVTGGGPAEKANMKAGDVVLSVSGKALRETRDLKREVLAREPGQTMELEILRDGKRYRTDITLGTKPEAPIDPLPMQNATAQSSMGFRVRELSAAEAKNAGIPGKLLPLVTYVAPGSAGDRSGLRGGDIVLEADGKVDPSAKDLEDAAKDGQVLVRVKRKEMVFYAALKK